ncbi:hypothetical protein [Corynebacterium sp. LK2510]|uniref:hypothetical protein n=1 Tax=Corynebacterium sp. LK2510 TaxID=3110472 RepID=UPI0034CF08BD
MTIAKTLPALALAAALSSTIVPAAQAQSSQEGAGQPQEQTQEQTQERAQGQAQSSMTGSSASAAAAAGQEDLPPLRAFEVGGVAGTYNGVNWYYHANETHVVDNTANVVADVTTLGTKAMTIEAFADLAGYRVPTKEDKAAGSNASSDSSSVLSPQISGTQLADASSLPALPLAAVGEFAGRLAGQDWFYNRDVSFVVNSRDLINQQVDAGQAGVKFTADLARELQRSLPVNVVVDGLSSTPGAQTPATAGLDLGSSAGEIAGSSANDMARLALFALPGILLIGGITWYLNQDGRTYVESSSRTSSAPSEQEIASSENMLSSNRSEVQRQALGGSSLGGNGDFGGSSAANGFANGSSNGADVNIATTAAQGRGIGAETGSNDFAKGLVGLVLASLIGAAVFFVGRRQLV